MKILAVDDTITYRSILKKAVGMMPDTELAGVASNGVTALEKIRQLRPDLVLLDIEMPKMDGLKTLEIIRKRYPRIGVIMVSGVTRRNADATIRALELGALDFIKKPERGTVEENIDYIVNFLRPILKVYTVRQGYSAPLSARRRSSTTTPPVEASPAFDLVIFGCSTGGPNTLMKIIPRLPSDFSLPVVIVQHMPGDFTASLSRVLDRKTRLPVKEAEHHEPLRGGTIYLAPGGKHLLINRSDRGAPYRFKLNEAPPVNNCRPSIDVTLNSLATRCRGTILMAILTGMGRDGATGIRAIKENGTGLCLTQKKGDCVVYGMPRVVEEMGLSDFSLTADEIVDKIIFLTRESHYASSR
jgi:two-component system chemotaxis response regulator CheB